MAPVGSTKNPTEQHLPSQVDVWSLGCILSELASGSVLFQNDSLATLLARLEGILGAVPQWMVKQVCAAALLHAHPTAVPWLRCCCLSRSMCEQHIILHNLSVGHTQQLLSPDVMLSPQRPHCSMHLKLERL